jgi:hypothetical protein
MINEFLPNELLVEEVVKRDYVLSTVERDDGWNGGTLVVPFKAAGASSVSYGALTASDDIAEDAYVRGEVSSPKEAWGAMLFKHRDIMEHGKISEQNFLKLLPDTIESFTDKFKAVISTNLLKGSHFAKLTATGDSSGNITVDRPDLFEIGQKVLVDDDNSTPVTGYVLAINMNTKVVNLATARGGSTAADYSAMTTAQNAKCYYEGAQSNGFSSLRGALLSATNGGDSTLYGQTKVTYPYLQAINVDGSAFTAVNFLASLFTALTTVRQFGKGAPNEAIMSYTNLSYCMAAIESQKGAFNVTPGSQKASQYGWMEISIGSVTGGMLKIVGVQEMDNDVVFIMDWRAVKFYSNGFFQKRKGPNGNEYFEIRATTGYSYIIDMCCFGELVVQRPSYCGIVHSISI